MLVANNTRNATPLTSLELIALERLLLADENRMEFQDDPGLFVAMYVLEPSRGRYSLVEEARWELAEDYTRKGQRRFRA